jgi:hypothetical protein
MFRTPTRELCATVAAAAAIGIAAGCGGSGDTDSTVVDAPDTATDRATTEKDRVRAAYDAIQQGFADGNGQAACAAMSTSARQELLGAPDGPKTCAAAIQAVSRDRQGVRDTPKVTSIRIRGAEAIIAVRYPKGSFPAQRFRMSNAGGEWQLATLAPIP